MLFKLFQQYVIAIGTTVLMFGTLLSIGPIFELADKLGNKNK